MAKLKKRQPVSAWVFGLNAILLGCLVFQLFLAGLLSLYGSIPIPAAWVNRLVAGHLPDGLRMEVEKSRIIGTELSFSGITIHHADISKPLLTLKAAEFDLTWKNFPSGPDFSEMNAFGGALYLPAAFAPDGRHTPLLERLTISSRQSGTAARNFSVAAMHSPMRIRGSITIPTLRTSQVPGDLEWLETFYRQAAKFAAQKQRIADFDEPTLVFAAHPTGPADWSVTLRATSPSIRHSKVHAEQIQLWASLAWKDERFAAIEAPFLSASRVYGPDYQIEAIDTNLRIAKAQITQLLQGEWPSFELAASQLVLPEFEIGAPSLGIDPAKYPEFQFRGSAGDPSGAVTVNGQVDLSEGSGRIQARGNLDLIQFVPPDQLSGLPEFRFATLPDYDLQGNFGSNFRLTDAHFTVQLDGLQIEGLAFDQLHAGGRLTEDRLSIDPLHLRRADQWVDLTFALDRSSDDYQLNLVGSAIPHDYNALLPNWWSGIFRDFDFGSTARCQGDFAIQGNTRRKVADLFYGHAEAANVAYRGVGLDSGTLTVRGRGRYAEIKDLEASSGKGWVQGDIAFTSRRDAIKSPVSVRLDLDAQLSPTDAGRLFGDEVAGLIGAFETDARPEISLQAALFNRAYPDYAGKSHFRLQAECSAPIRYAGIPFDSLALRLEGRSEHFYLRDIAFAFAGGEGNARMDITTREEQAPLLRYELALVDVEQNRALDPLPGAADFRQSILPPEGERPSPAEEAATVPRLDLQLHGEGPADAMWEQSGFGRFEIRNEGLATIQLLGPLSRLLQNTELNFTSFNLNTMQGKFAYTGKEFRFDPLKIDGLRSQILAPGRLNLEDQSLDMRVSVFLLRNAGNPDSRLRQIGDLLSRPIPNLLEFELTGTLQDQKFRSLYDPRNLLPDL